MKYLKNEKGNTMLFIIGLFSVFFLMFLLILSFANVFIEKEHASNNAEQASIVASGIITKHLALSIEEYDDYLKDQFKEAEEEAKEEAEENEDNEDYEPPELEEPELLSKQIEELLPTLPNYLKESEKKHQAINKIIKRELNKPDSHVLRMFIASSLSNAESEIYSEVSTNIQRNGGQVSETEIWLNENQRIEVKTATKYEAFKYDEYFSDNQRHVRQTGQGPSFELFDSFAWGLNISY
ncbi:hypothetical protein [Cytobacillus sp. FSL R7-0680]|uniref:hypothetical protein n=1 Tax=Cytobacillus sp. FSL R7-0680 TaxID=2921689 RepID=UPI0030FAB328